MSMQDIVRIFANRMYNYRIEMNMTQQELADALDLDNSYISLLERGARIPSIITLERIANVFGIRPVDFISESRKDEKLTFKQRELLYIIEDGDPEVIDKIYTISKIASVDEP